MQYTTDLENSGMELHLASLDITAFLRQRVSNYELQAKKKGITIIWSVQNAPDLPFSADVEKLERVLDNIVSNSLTYTPQCGYIHITVRFMPDFVQYEIQDSGTGFNKKDLEKGFDKFYRGDESRKSGNGHSGLGLYIAKQLVEKMGGSIQLGNASEGGGLMFGFSTGFMND
ncbi:hypothetical protein Back11_01200 [Paenibacillus baekrokdamisoli]|uniref:histidine kinase n=1 Tax=Paenibacillus baekrokdamisoli TaxID=1712516 RepID=A0A3G9IS46_9BACL|nr:HAMP domain-containing sensor histidine kinase [Paenibacillus baekrokdamisoli]MBB3069252.1 signal transduction histidine kinase [Paenibacillus baekrokdamisoli]BBH18775.1 hypothetical protein Back11_01200 [Paenibacillus baekrokdamisoli]